ncbi:malonate decarboxylase holo-[acyl-carrier-protein] synthase [Labrys monachus]|nr:malonate decarboxylase holo-[acyl-carrier-protein] synthase [Labrys monachus]
MRIERHDIVHLDPAAWPEIVADHPALQAVPEIAGWTGATRPLIARRPACGDRAGMVPLGLALPPALGKRRLALGVRPDAIAAVAPPPRLADAAAAAPAGWRDTIAALVAAAPATRCFGSLAWTWLTGLPYGSATSDIDLLWRVASPDRAAGLAAAITTIEARAPMRLDGEFVTPRNLAVQWREWASAAPEVLAKSADDCRMAPRAMLFA